MKELQGGFWVGQGSLPASHGPMGQKAYRDRVERLFSWKAYLGLQRAEHFCFGEPGLHACGPTLELDHQNFMSSAMRARRCGHVGIAQSVTARYAYRYLPTLLVSSWTNAGSI